MIKIKQWLCGLFGHPMIFIPDSSVKSEDAYYKCKRCGFTLDYYF